MESSAYYSFAGTQILSSLRLSRRAYATLCVHLLGKSLNVAAGFEASPHDLTVLRCVNYGEGVVLDDVADRQHRLVESPLKVITPWVRRP